MTPTDRIQFAAILALLAALLGSLWALSEGMTPAQVLQVTGLAYGAAAAGLRSLLQVSYADIVLQSAKSTALVLAYIVGASTLSLYESARRLSRATMKASMGVRA
ncbi:hypothetical protein ACWF95_33970 [Streptomyces vinaceus]